MEQKRVLKDRLTLLLATFLATGSLAAAMLTTGCSKSADPDSSEQTVASAQAESAKAAAEAEAAEEEFAKTKNAKNEKANRKVASVRAAKASGKGTSNADSESTYIVQVGTFKLEENAKNLTAKLKAAGLPVFQKKIEREGATLYAVRIEPTPNRTEAEKFVSSVKAATGESSLILSVGR